MNSNNYLLFLSVDSNSEWLGFEAAAFVSV